MNSRNGRPVIAITMGDPGGIGAEVIVDFTVRRGILARVTERLGASIGNIIARRLGLEGLFVY